jgi:hypothetical protein
MTQETERVRRIALERDPFGRLVARIDGCAHVDVAPVRAFPLSAPDEGFALLDAAGHELAWFADPAALGPDAAQLFRAALAEREFMPEITSLLDVSSYSVPSTWRIGTDRGPTDLVLRALEDIRHVAPRGLLITDTHGIHYRVLDIRRLDRKSRRFLEHFL